MLIVHRMNVQVRLARAIALTVFLLLGCSDSDSPIYCFDSIDSSERAENITEQLIYSIYSEIRDLPGGTYVDKVVSGARGKMTINGAICHFCGNYPKRIIDVNVKMESYSRLPQKRNNTNGEVNWVEDNGFLTITDNGSPITFTIDDPYIYPSEGFYYCQHSFDDISDTITAFSASASTGNLWGSCPYTCSAFRPYGYIITGNGQFNF